MKGKAKDIFIHVTGWAIFLLFPPLFTPGPPFSADRILDPYMLRELVAYVLLIIFFYVNTHVLIPTFYFKKRFFSFYALTLLCFSITTLVPFLLIINHYPMHHGPPKPGGDSILFEFGHNFFGFSLVAFISFVSTISNQLKNTEQQKLIAEQGKLKAEQEKLNVELSYLKAQINPHFLFNTLNSIYSLAIEKSDKTPEAVVMLSSMMRYVVSEAHQDFVSLAKELEYIRSYIALQQIRFDDTIQLMFSIEGNSDSKKIGPLILIPFVENAFKHGVNAEEISRIRIAIRVEGNSLYLEVYNHKVFVQKNDENKSGLGIENTRNRLQLVYPDRHTLHIRNAKDDFLILLTLDLQ